MRRSRSRQASSPPAQESSSWLKPPRRCGGTAERTLVGRDAARPPVKHLCRNAKRVGGTAEEDARWDRDAAVPRLKISPFVPGSALHVAFGSEGDKSAR